MKISNTLSDMNPTIAPRFQPCDVTFIHHRRERGSDKWKSDLPAMRVPA